MHLGIFWPNSSVKLKVNIIYPGSMWQHAYAHTAFLLSAADSLQNFSRFAVSDDPFVPRVCQGVTASPLAIYHHTRNLHFPATARVAGRGGEFNNTNGQTASSVRVRVAGPSMQRKSFLEKVPRPHSHCSNKLLPPVIRVMQVAYPAEAGRKLWRASRRTL